MIWNWLDIKVHSYHKISGTYLWTNMKKSSLYTIKLFDKSKVPNNVDSVLTSV